jgi:hypothetical protein
VRAFSPHRRVITGEASRGTEGLNGEPTGHLAFTSCKKVQGNGPSFDALGVGGKVSFKIHSTRLPRLPPSPLRQLGQV